MLPPVTRRGERDEQPEQGAGEVDPDGILHAGDGAVAASVFVEVELGKDAKQGNVEDKKHQIPDGRDDAERVKHKGDEVGEAGHARKAADDDSKNPFGVGMRVRLPRPLNVGSIQPNDGEPEHKDEKVGDGKAEVTFGDVETAEHGCGVVCNYLWRGGWWRKMAKRK